MLFNTSVGDGQKHAFFGYCTIFVELLLAFTLLRRGKTSPGILDSESYFGV